MADRTMKRRSEYRCPRNGTSGHVYTFQMERGRNDWPVVRMVCRHCGRLVPGAPKKGVIARPLRTEGRPA